MKRLKTDRIDKALGCLRLRWYQTTGKTGILSAAREFGFVPADVIRGSVHIFRRNTMRDIINGKDSRYQNHFSICDKIGG